MVQNPSLAGHAPCTRHPSTAAYSLNGLRFHTRHTTTLRVVTCEVTEGSPRAQLTSRRICLGFHMVKFARIAVVTFPLRRQIFAIALTVYNRGDGGIAQSCLRACPSCLCHSGERHRYAWGAPRLRGRHAGPCLLSRDVALTPAGFTGPGRCRDRARATAHRECGRTSRPDRRGRAGRHLPGRGRSASRRSRPRTESRRRRAR